VPRSSSSRSGRSRSGPAGSTPPARPASISPALDRPGRPAQLARPVSQARRAKRARAARSKQRAPPAPERSSAKAAPAAARITAARPGPEAPPRRALAAAKALENRAVLAVLAVLVEAQAWPATRAEAGRPLAKAELVGRPWPEQGACLLLVQAAAIPSGGRGAVIPSQVRRGRVRRARAARRWQVPAAPTSLVPVAPAAQAPGARRRAPAATANATRARSVIPARQVPRAAVAARPARLRATGFCRSGTRSPTPVSFSARRPSRGRRPSTIANKMAASSPSWTISRRQNAWAMRSARWAPSGSLASRAATRKAAAASRTRRSAGSGMTARKSSRSVRAFRGKSGNRTTPGGAKTVPRTAPSLSRVTRCCSTTHPAATPSSHCVKFRD
jgi:hypothetical protein